MLRTMSVMLGVLGVIVQAQAAEVMALQCGDVFDSKSARLVGARTIVRARMAGSARCCRARDRAGRPRGGPRRAHLHAGLDRPARPPGQESNPQSYEERFRLDDTDFAFRAVGYAEKTLQAGFTTVRDLGGEVALEAARRDQRRACVKGPRIYAAGKSIATTGGHADPTNGMNSRAVAPARHAGPTEGVINSADDARQAVRQRYKDGSDLIKITATGGVLSYAKSGDAPQFTVDEVRAVVETARDYGYTVAAHAHGKEGMRRAIEGGVTSIEHGTYMDDEIFALMKKHGTWYVPTITAGKFVAEKAKVAGLPARDRASQGRADRRADPGHLRQGLQGRREDRDSAPTRASARTATTRASSATWSRPACRPPRRCSPRRTTPPRCSARDDLGQLEPGFHADVVAVPGNPLADIALTRKVAS